MERPGAGPESTVRLKSQDCPGPRTAVQRDSVNFTSGEQARIVFGRGRRPPGVPDNPCGGRTAAMERTTVLNSRLDSSSWLAGPFALQRGGSPLLVSDVGDCGSSSATKQVDCRQCAAIDTNALDVLTVPAKLGRPQSLRPGSSCVRPGALFGVAHPRARQAPVTVLASSLPPPKEKVVRASLKEARVKPFGAGQPADT